MVLVSLVAAALVAQLYLLLRDLDVAPRIALVTPALLAVLHPFLTYASAEIEPELFAAMLFVTAVRALRHGTRSSVRALAVASTCAGLIGIFTTRGWFLSLGLGVCVAVLAVAPRVVLVALGIEALVAAWGRLGWAAVAVLALPPALVTGLYAVEPSLGYDLAVDVQRTGYPGRLWAYVYEHWGVDPGLVFPSIVRPDASTPASLLVWCAIALAFVVLGAVLRPALRPGAARGSPGSSASD